MPVVTIKGLPVLKKSKALSKWIKTHTGLYLYIRTRKTNADGCTVMVEVNQAQAKILEDQLSQKANAGGSISVFVDWSMARMMVKPVLIKNIKSFDNFPSIKNLPNKTIADQSGPEYYFGQRKARKNRIKGKKPRVAFKQEANLSMEPEHRDLFEPDRPRYDDKVCLDPTEEVQLAMEEESKELQRQMEIIRKERALLEEQTKLLEAKRMMAMLKEEKEKAMKHEPPVNRHSSPRRHRSRSPIHRHRRSPIRDERNSGFAPPAREIPPLLVDMQPRRPSPDRRYQGGEIRHDAFQRHQSPVRRYRSPERFRRSSERINRSPERFHRSQERFNQSPERFNRSPKRSNGLPERFNQSPQRFNRSPKHFNGSPERFNRLPERFNPPPPERSNRSPERFNPPQGRHSRSPGRFHKPKERLPRSQERNFSHSNSKSGPKSSREESRKAPEPLNVWLPVKPQQARDEPKPAAFEPQKWDNKMYGFGQVYTEYPPRDSGAIGAQLQQVYGYMQGNFVPQTTSQNYSEFNLQPATVNRFDDQNQWGYPKQNEQFTNNIPIQLNSQLGLAYAHDARSVNQTELTRGNNFNTGKQPASSRRNAYSTGGKAATKEEFQGKLLNDACDIIMSEFSNKFNTFSCYEEKYGARFTKVIATVVSKRLSNMNIPAKEINRMKPWEVARKYNANFSTKSSRHLIKLVIDKLDGPGNTAPSTSRGGTSSGGNIGYKGEEAWNNSHSAQMNAASSGSWDIGRR